MFGIIPKALWSKQVEVDQANRIPLAMSCFLVQSAGRRILVETGAGTKSKYDPKEQEIFKFADHWILDSLNAAGVDGEQIDVVVLTHLHFDHAGGGTMLDGRGGYQPTFPNARYVIQRGEWDDAVSGYAVMTGTYREENLAPLERTGVLHLIEGEAEIAPGVRVLPMPGHTRHQQGVWFTSADQRVLLPADLMPTAAHVGERYNMAYDLMPYENMRNKRRLLAEARTESFTLLLGQDPHSVHWRVEADQKGCPTLAPADEPCFL